MQFLPDQLPMNLGVRDRMIWAWDTKRVFSVRSAYCRLNDSGLWCPFAKVIWSIRVPLIGRVFFWLVLNNAILIWDNLKKIE